MTAIAETPSLGLLPPSKRECPIKIRLADKSLSPSDLVRELASEKGELEIICWYEGTSGLPVKGAKFYEKEIFKPLYSLKKDVRFTLYSLLGWDFKKTKNVNDIPASKLAGCVARMQKSAITCLQAKDSFFQSCLSVKPEDKLYTEVGKALPKMEKLVQLSAGRDKVNRTVQEFFLGQSSVLDCIGGSDVNLAYSQMQFMEGYFLIREAVLAGKKKAFVLPSGERSYYEDYLPAYVKMLEAEFGDTLWDKKADISFWFFDYDGKPYIDKTDKAPFVKSQEIENYWKFYRTPFIPRDIVHNLYSGGTP